MLAQSLVTLALAASASALHIERRVEMSASYAIAGLRSPKARGWAEASATVSPCGGFEINNRTSFPMTGGQISMLLTDEAYLLELGFSNLSSPTSNDDFLPLVNTLNGGDQIGHLCQAGPDMADFGLEVGQNVTLQLEYRGGEGGTVSYFQCADIVLVEPTPENTNVTCFSATVSASSLDGDAGTYHSSSSSSSAGLSNAASGGIGAGVTIGVMLLLLLALWKTGIVAIAGTKNQKSAASSTVLPGPGANKTSDTSSLGSSSHPAEKKF